MSWSTSFVMSDCAAASVIKSPMSSAISNSSPKISLSSTPVTSCANPLMLDTLSAPRVILSSIESLDSKSDILVTFCSGISSARSNSGLAIDERPATGRAPG